MLSCIIKLLVICLKRNTERSKDRAIREIIFKMNKLYRNLVTATKTTSKQIEEAQQV